MVSADLETLNILSLENPSLRATNDYEKALTYQYLEWKQKFVGFSGNKANQKSQLTALSEDLMSRVFLTGNSLKGIDIVIARCIEDHLFGMSFDEKEKLCGALRWYTLVQKLYPSLMFVPFQRTKIY
ncbi:eukaryotic translation elongation factor 1 [Echinococcus multilocularis]|uniref:Eukaryotic translation elongation factor 1 n=1 Tax=Echinococcus multilocularis TaxID=6211 RepID=A0A087W032_ECHMU|nr:eukaryotic translation elongation factor 1 [Echinococcus multilocularis]